MIEHDARTLPAAALAVVACAVATRSGQWLAIACLLGATGAVLGLAALLLHGQRAPRVRSGARVTRWAPALRAGIAAAAVAACLAAVPAAAGAWRHATAMPDDVAAAVARGDRIEVSGVVIADPRAAGRDPWSGQPRQSVRVRVAGACVAPCTTMHPAAVSVDAVVHEGAVPRMGDQVLLAGTPAPSRDGRSALVLWQASATPTDDSDPFLSAIDTARMRVREQAASLPDDVRGLTLGMVLGDTDQMPPDLVEAMRLTGLTHLTAVSGSHFAIVTLALGALLRRLLRRRWVRAAVLASAMAGLAAFVGPEPSVQRALTMALAVAAGIAWGRPSRALPALGGGVLALLAIEPALAASVGLHLSACAVLGIVVWAPHVRRLLCRWLLPPVAAFVSIPLAAWLACWPLLTALEPGVALYTVPANMVAGLAAFPVTLVGLAGAVAGQVSAPLGSGLLTGASWGAWPVVWSARAFSHAPGAWLEWPAGPGGMALASAVLSLLVLGTAARTLRVAVRLAVTLAAVVITIATPAIEATFSAVPADATLVVCDVGQGDMMLVMVGSDEAIVVDTGPPDGDGVGCLRRYGVRTIPLLVLTHPHADHDGNAAVFAATVGIEAAWVSPAAAAPPYDVAATSLERAGVPVSVPVPGQRFEAGNVQLTVLTAAATTGVHMTSADLNDASIALWIDAGGVTALALGDLELDGQDLLEGRLNGTVVVDLVKVAHHGSATQSDNLASRISARVAAMSVGNDNPYGHPAPRTIELYRARSELVLSTARCGDIVVTAQHRVAARCPPGVAG